METYWMVYVEGGTLPTHRHVTLQSARYEAERLVRQEKKPVYVLEVRAIEVCRFAESPIKWGTLGDQG